MPKVKTGGLTADRDLIALNGNDIVMSPVTLFLKN